MYLITVSFGPLGFAEGSLGPLGKLDTLCFLFLTFWRILLANIFFQRHGKGQSSVGMGKARTAAWGTKPEEIETALGFICEFPKIRGTLFGGPYNKDPTI